ncbi:MAG TPA: deoxyribodipyrimidine photo-lyase [Nocardioides sp.]|nr:deoxyribodipyrimidine photo-lyase [Nocardioides sp.]
MATQVLWFRRDLRLTDHAALLAAASAAGDDGVVPLFVLDPALLRPSGAPRVAFLLRSLRALDADLRRHGPGLVVRSGRPEDVLPEFVAEAGAEAVHVSADFGPYGAERDRRVEDVLEVPLVRTGSPYAVAPGRVLTGGGTPYRVFTPFLKAWLAHGWRAPAASDAGATVWRGLPSEGIPDDPDLDGTVLPEAGEAAAHGAWSEFLDRLPDYAQERDRPDLDSTSRLSAYLKIGAIHPRTLLADLGPDDTTYRAELAWREFYADVLHHQPESARSSLHPELDGLPWAGGDLLAERLAAWAEGRTGYPLVDAGMRQLRAEGWMHNRVRMLVASFLVKDLKVEWRHGARHFMTRLVDGDLASNQHGWQWTAGCGTDASPYFRIFNPVTQSRRFDPSGDYIRRWVPELRDLGPKEIHEPWRAGPPDGYPAPIVDHGEERASALAAYDELRRGR